MKFQIFFVSFLIGISLAQRYVRFDTTTLPCAGPNGQCDFNNGTIWVGGVVPGADAIAAIDLSQTTDQGAITFFSNANVTLDGIVIAGTTTYKVQFIVGQQSVLQIHQNFTLTHGSLTQSAGTKVLSSTIEFIDGDYANNGGDIEISVYLNFDNASIFQASQGATVSLVGDNIFNNQPYVKDTSLFNAVGSTTFNAGFKSEGNTIIGSAVLYGESTANAISVIHNLTLDSGATLKVTDINGTTVSNVRVNDLSILEVNGNPDTGTAYFNNLITEVNSATNITTSTLTITRFDANGKVCLDQISNANVANGEFNDLFLAGKVSMQAKNTKIGNMGMTQSTHGGQPSFYVSFVGSGNTICNTTGNGFENLSLTVMNTAKLFMGAGCTFSAEDDPSNFDILGQFTAVGATIRAEITTHSTDAIIVLNNTYVYDDINMQGGELNPANLTIVDNLYITNMGYLSMDFNGDTLSVGGDIRWENTTLYFNQFYNGEASAPVYAGGIIYIEGATSTLIMDFHVDIVNSLRYNILEANSNITGQFQVITVLAPGTKTQTTEKYSTYVDNVSNTFYMMFTSADGSRDSHKLAGWKIFLIILSVFIVLGGIVAAFFYLRRTKGYMRLN